MTRAVKPLHVARMPAADEESATRISAFLFENLAASGVSVASYEQSGAWKIEVQSPHPLVRAQLAALAKLAGGGQEPAIELAELAPEDWIAANREAFRPVRVGRFTIHGVHDRQRVAPNAIGMEIEAAAAFGTGHHPSTQGCLHAIETYARRSARRHGTRVLDIGTGTGILAIAAVRSAPARATASDVDPVAIKIAAANAAANKAGTLVRFVGANGVTHPAIRAGAPYDLVLANIVLAPLQRLAGPVSRLVRSGSTVVLSGLTVDQANAALARWQSHGFVLRRRRTVENWATLILVRR